MLTQKLSNIGLDLQVKGTFTKPTLFVRGARSSYVQDADWNRITTIFPEATLETMDTGHWVQAEKPIEFVELTRQWLNR